MRSPRPLDVILSEMDGSQRDAGRVLRTWQPYEIEVESNAMYSSDTSAHRFTFGADSTTYPYWTVPLPTLGARSLLVGVMMGASTSCPSVAVDLFTGMRPTGGSTSFWPWGTGADVQQLVRSVVVQSSNYPPDAGNLYLFESDPSQGDEKQMVTLKGAPTGGTYTLTFAAQTTSALAFDATCATVQTALAALSTIGTGNVLVTGTKTPNLAHIVQFSGMLAGTPQALITGDGASLTGGSTPSVIIGRLPRQEVLGDWWRLRIRAAGTTCISLIAQARA